MQTIWVRLPSIPLPRRKDNEDDSIATASVCICMLYDCSTTIRSTLPTTFSCSRTSVSYCFNDSLACIVMDPSTYVRLEELIRTLREPKDWVSEINLLTELMDKLHSAGKSTTVRSMAKITNKSKSWIGVSTIISKGLKTYPEISRFSNRNEAYNYLLRKNKMKRFLES